MKRFLYNLFLFLLFFLFLALAFSFRTCQFTVNPLINMDLESLEVCTDREEAKAIIIEVANKTSHIKSISATKIDISLKRITASGSLHYCQGRLRFVVNSFFGKEIDIGSNDSIFWFWSKRIKPKALYYSAHENSCDESLKPVFNKEWITDCFIFSDIKQSSEDEIFKLNNFLLIKRPLSKSLNHVVTVIDREQLVVTSKYLIGTEGEMLASVTYEGIDCHLVPRIINMCWHEEGVFMRWDIKEVKINKYIDELFWKVPPYQPKVDISTME